MRSGSVKLWCEFAVSSVVLVACIFPSYRALACTGCISSAPSSKNYLSANYSGATGGAACGEAKTSQGWHQRTSTLGRSAPDVVSREMPIVEEPAIVLLLASVLHPYPWERIAPATNPPRSCRICNPRCR